MTAEGPGTPGGAIPPSVRHEMENARRALLALHKALLEAERVEYEDEHGRIETSGDFLRIAMHDPWFAWLRPLLATVVLMDDVLAADEPPVGSSVEELLAHARHFLKPSAEGDAFQRRYHELLQEAPSVVIAHSLALRLLRGGSASPA